SLWYQWSAAQDGWMTFDTSTPAGLDTLVAAYTGSALASLFEAAFDDNYGSKTGGRISFPVTAGTNYFISVASRLRKDPPVGSFTLSWYPTPAPGFTSSFRPATGTPGTKVTLLGTNFIGATAVLFNGASAVFTNALTNNRRNSFGSSTDERCRHHIEEFSSGNSAAAFSRFQIAYS